MSSKWTPDQQSIHNVTTPLKSTPTVRVSGRNSMIWVNIIAQLLFPLSAAFTPAFAAMASQKVVITDTQSYILTVGETTSAIAARHELTLDQLKQLNQFRKFSVPFSNLEPGNEIDVPRTASFWASSTNETDSQQHTLANRALSAGSVLSADNSRQAAGGLVRSELSGEAKTSA